MIVCTSWAVNTVKLWFQARLVVVLAVTLMALLIILQYQPHEQPILADRAYLIYMGQSIFRGEPVYETSTLGYPPFNFLLSAAMMHLLDHRFGIHSYLAPRILSILLAATSIGLLYTITLKITRSQGAGLIAGLTLLSFELFNVLSVSNLEPKLLVQFLALLAILGLITNRWWLAGVVSGMALMTWQPALILVLVTFLICLKTTRRRGWRPIALYTAGFFLGLLPSFLYLILTQQVDDFTNQVVAFKLLSRQEIVESNPFQPLFLAFHLAGSAGPGSILLLALATFGSIAYVKRMKRRSWKAALDASFRPRQGGLFLLSISWLMYLIISSVTGIEVQGLLDLLPVLFLIAFWTAWGALELFIWVETSPWRNQIRLGTPANRGKILWSLFTLVLFGYTMTKAAFYRLPYTLAEERDFVHSITSTTRGDASLLAINAEEFYVLTEQTSPWRAVRVNPYFLQFMEQIETRDCDDLIQDLDRNHYQLVVVKEKSQWKHACMALILAHLETQYQQTTFQSAERGCNTMALLQSLGEKPLQTMANFNGPIWFRCLRDKQWRNPAVQLNSGTYHVFTFG